jgi:serine/threonine-protein kinase
MTGHTLGQYRVEARLGKGGMGEVYVAEDTRLKRRIALKVLPSAVAGDRERRARFEREAQAIAALNHPNIVTIHSVERADPEPPLDGKADGSGSTVHFITMEFVDGETLSRMIPEGGLSLERLFEIAVPLADAVAAAHERGITHRDLKPDNVMVTRDGRVKVLDFGLAKLGARGADPEATATLLAANAVTQEGKILGTVRYMSPEQAEGKSVDVRSDVFSLGIMLYEMATGRCPFRGETPISTISAILKDEPVSLTDMKQGLPRHLDRIVRRCLAKDRERRYSTAREVRLELEDLREETRTGEWTRTGLRGQAGDSGGVRELQRAPGDSSSPELSAGFAAHAESGPAGVAQSATPHSGDSWRAPSSGSGGESPAAPRRRRWIYALLVLGAILILWQIPEGEDSQGTAPREDSAAGESRDAKSVAVLPFVDMSPERDQQYFSDGLAEELIIRLGRIEGLHVAGRTSSFAYRETGEDLRLVAEKLDVASILEGSVRKAGDRVRVTAQLVDAQDGYNIWSDSYDRRLDDIFAIQEEIADSIARALQLTFEEGPGRRGAAGQETESVEAYQLYLQGRYHWQQRTEGSIRKSIELFERAIELDPEFARARSGLAAAYYVLPGYSEHDFDEVLARAEEAAERAIAAAAGLSEPHAVLGGLQTERLRWIESDASFRTALELEPDDPTTLLWYGGLLLRAGRVDEAALLLEKARELDPASGVTCGWLSLVHRIRGEKQEALDLLDRARELGWGAADFWLGKTLLDFGEFELLEEHLLRESQQVGPGVHGDVEASPLEERLLEFVREPTTERRSALLELVGEFEDSGLGMSMAILLQDEDLAIEMLGDFIDDFGGGFELTELWIEKARPVRQHPDFAALVSKAGLIDYWRARGWPDNCRADGDDGLVCD